MKHSSGFTMIELLVTVVIMAILAALAAPSFASLIRDYAVSSQLNALNADMRFARGEAIKRGASVTLCASPQPSIANPVCGGSDWKTGWIIFLDTNAGGTRSTVASKHEDVIRRQESFGTASNGITAQNGSAVKSMRFNSDGRISGGANNLEFRSAGNSSEEISRLLCISITGRPRAAGKGVTTC
jgi:type IV fimbrial biogenesis protein FimT